MNIRLLPIVMVSTAALLVLKAISLVASDGFVLTPMVLEAAAQDASGDADAQAAAGEGNAPAMPQEGAVAGDEPAGPVPALMPPSDTVEDLGKSRSERAVLERLRDRREQLDGRERQLELREQLLRAAEKRIEQRVVEMKALEESIGVAATKKAEQEKQEFANLAKMYSAMKPKDAARIFDRLELSILVKVSKAMKPVKLADVMARMSAEAAERLTVELATGGMGVASAPTMDELPKIGAN